MSGVTPDTARQRAEATLRNMGERGLDSQFLVRAEDVRRLAEDVLALLSELATARQERADSDTARLDAEERWHWLNEALDHVSHLTEPCKGSCMAERSLIVEQVREKAKELGEAHDFDSEAELVVVRRQLAELTEAANDLLGALTREKIIYARSINVRSGIEALRAVLDAGQKQ